MINGRWVAREARGQAPLLACLFVLAAVLSSIALAGPVLLDRLSGHALGNRVAAAQRQGELLVTSATMVAYQSDPGSEEAVEPPETGELAAALKQSGQEIRDAARPPLHGLLKPGSVRTDPVLTDISGGVPGSPRAQLSLLYADDAPAASAYAEGGPPSALPDAALKDSRPIPVAVSTQVRDAYGLKLGERLDLGGDFTDRVVLSGFFEAPQRLGDVALFRQQPGLAAPLTETRGSGGLTVRRALAVVDGTGLEVLQGRHDLDVQLVWRTRMALGDERAKAIAAADGGAALQRALGRFRRDASEGLCPGAAAGAECQLAGRRIFQPATTNELTTVVDDFRRDRAQAGALSAFAVAGLLAVAFATVVVTAQLAVRRGEFTDRLQRARGATALEVAQARLAQTGPAVLLGAAAGYAAVRATVEEEIDSGLTAVVVVALAALTLPALTWFSVRERKAEQGRRGGARRAVSGRRLMAETAVLLLAVGLVAAIRVRGDGASGGASGVDPQLAATPVLLGLATVLVLMRLYPLPVRFLARRARARRGAVAFVALARVGRTAAGRELALLVLVLTLATAVFGGLISSTAAEGRERAAAWNAGGQAAVVTPEADAGAAGAWSAVPGVEHTLAVRRADVGLESATDGRVRGTTSLIGLDPEQLRAAVPGSPAAAALLGAELELPQTQGASTVLPALAAGPPAAYEGRTLTLDGTHGTSLSVRIIGTLDDAAAGDPALGPVSGPSAPSSLLLVDAAAMAQVDRSDIEAAAVLLYGAKLDPVAVRTTALTSAGPGAQVRMLDEELDALREDGLLRSVLLIYTASSATAVLLALLAVVLELLLSAPERGRTASYLRTLGLGSRPTALVHFLELLPMVVAATVGGVALGLLLPDILGPALALRDFTGGPGARLVTDYGLTAALAGGLVALVVIAVAVETARGRRRALGSVLRVGETK
ncbi:hypothetical protein LRD69_09945 [Streptomyces sp. JH14]|uniref:hypothetical protein n=1 Tax=Streptomyces sp. JH14 TaxID=2793630 RepID=UPI0023F97DE7|nr:hypothetical protein [Streptomyces sp. JH14]MDF6042475.1 hypothetical protein [Streptomyces sp. JH14]